MQPCAMMFITASSFQKVLYHHRQKILVIFLKESDRYRGDVECMVIIGRSFNHVPSTSANSSNRAMGRDEEVYPDPSRFDPGRYLTAEGKLIDEPTCEHFGFGFGRFVMDHSLRKCD